MDQEQPFSGTTTLELCTIENASVGKSIAGIHIRAKDPGIVTVPHGTAHRPFVGNTQFRRQRLTGALECDGREW